MNLLLRKEILKHVFNVFGIYREGIFNGSTFIEPLILDKFLIDKKLIFETEDNKKYENNIWAIKTEIETSIIKIMIADTSEELQEFTILLQMDNFSYCAMRLSSEAKDYGSMYFYVADNWVDAGTLAQGKVLTGIESLSEIFIEWNKMDDYAEMYKKLIDFLNFYERVQI